MYYRLRGEAMFNKFARFFCVENVIKIELNTSELAINLPEDVIEFLVKFEGSTFSGGIYRVHKLDEIKKWDEIVTGAYPEFKDRIHCFGYDWLGRQFAIDKKRMKNDKPLVLMFEPGTADVLEIPCDFENFHEFEIIEYHDACLASSLYQQWRSEVGNKDIERSKCAGYKVPLFLGGTDNVSNLELNDIDVYWTICSELIRKAE